MLGPAEARHAVIRGGAYDLAFEGAWSDEADQHPFGLAGTGARFAASIPGAERAQANAFAELCAELGPLQPGSVPAALARTGLGTADPPSESTALAFSCDGRWLATGHRSEARVWDAATGLHIAQIRLAGEEVVRTIAFSHDHVQLLLATDQRIVMCEVASGEPITLDVPQLPPDYGTERLAAWLPDGRILTAEANIRHANVALVDPRTTRTIATRRWKATDAESVSWVRIALSCDHERVAISVLHEGALAIWNTATLEIDHHLPVPADRCDIAFADRDLLYTVTSKAVYAHTTEGSHEVSDVRREDLACSPDGRALAWQVGVGVGLHDLATRRTTRLDGAYPPFTFSPDGLRLATWTSSGFAAIWSVGALTSRRT
jgi:WD40 repeat protein